MADQASSTLVNGREEFNKLLTLLENAGAAADLQAIEDDKENLPPNKHRLDIQECAEQAKKARLESARNSTQMQHIEDRVRRLEAQDESRKAELSDMKYDMREMRAGQRVCAFPLLVTGKAQLRYDLLDKLCKVEGKKHSSYLGENSSNREDYGEGRWAEGFAARLRRDGNRDPFADFLKKHNLPQLATYYNFVQDGDLREARNAEAHEGLWKTFAFVVVQGADTNAKCEELLTAYAEAFKFAYGCTWQQAANEARAAQRLRD